MSLKYNSRDAHNLVNNIGESNNMLCNIGNNLKQLKYIDGWNDKLFEQYEEMLNVSLFNIGHAMNNQNEYKTDLENRIKELEN